MKKIIYVPLSPHANKTLKYSTTNGKIIINSGIPIEISDKNFSYLMEKNEEFKLGIEQSVIRVIESGVEEKSPDSTQETPPPSPPEEKKTTTASRRSQTPPTVT